MSLAAAAVFSAGLEGSARAESRAPLLPSPAAHYPPGTHYKPLCPKADAHGRRCYGLILVGADDKPISDSTAPPGGWTPIELEAAYGVPTTGGPSTVIATFIGAHYTNAESDVATYRAKFGLPPCTTANGCFTQIDSDTGSTTDFSGLTDDGCNGFVGEESLDVTMLQAGCPTCKILVLEGNNNASAISTAQSHSAVSMSMSWGYTPESESDCNSNWNSPPAGLALFAASGDQGYTATPGEPASCTNVIAVGWTQLATASTARGYADTLPNGWGSAGGCDTNMTKASWQTDPSCSSRMISDISANGDDVAVYCTSPAGSSNWTVTGGSSAASPFTTSLLASFGVTGGSFDAAWIYANEDEFWDVTSGGPVQNCPSGSPDYFCNAVPGYDGPTGVGTPYGPGFTNGNDAGADDAGDDASTGDDAGNGSGSGSSSGSSSGGLSSGSGSSSGGPTSGSGSGSGGGLSSGSGSSSGGAGGSDDGGSGSSSEDGGPSNSATGSSSSSGCGCAVVGATAEDQTGSWLAMSALLATIGFRTRTRRRGCVGGDVTR